MVTRPASTWSRSTERPSTMGNRYATHSSGSMRSEVQRGWADPDPDEASEQVGRELERVQGDGVSGRMKMKATGSRTTSWSERHRCQGSTQMTVAMTMPARQTMMTPCR